MELTSFENEKFLWGEYCYIVIFTPEQRKNFFEEIHNGGVSEPVTYMLRNNMRFWLDEMNIDYSITDYPSKINKFPELYLKNKEDYIMFKLTWD